MAAIALGGAQHALELGVKFAIERKQFGVEIAQKGAIQAFIADSAVEVETLRSQIYRCASLAEQGRLDGEAASIAKLWANRVAYQVANRMIQTHGGYGYILDYAIGRVFRDCRTIEAIDGGSHTHQTAIARSVLAAHGLALA
jgi:alkylation response protein AidB-like acyl-CoA dehydrogenase